MRPPFDRDTHKKEAHCSAARLLTLLHSAYAVPQEHERAVLQCYRFLWQEQFSFKPEEKQKIVKTLSLLSVWNELDSFTKNVPVDEQHAVDCSVGDTLRLVCCALLDGSAYPISALPHQDKCLRVYSLFQLCLSAPDGMCSGGWQHALLGLLNGGWKGLWTIEDFFAFLFQNSKEIVARNLLSMTPPDRQIILMWDWVQVLWGPLKNKPFPENIQTFLNEQQAPLAAELTQLCKEYDLQIVPEASQSSIKAGRVHIPSYVQEYLAIGTPPDCLPVMALMREFTQLGHFSYFPSKFAKLINQRNHAYLVVSAKIATLSSHEHVKSVLSSFVSADDYLRHVLKYSGIACFYPENLALCDAMSRSVAWLSQCYEVAETGVPLADFDRQDDLQQLNEFAMIESVSLMTDYFALSASDPDNEENLLGRLDAFFPAPRRFYVSDEMIKAWLSYYSPDNPFVILIYPHAFNHILFFAFTTPYSKWSDELCRVLYLILDFFESDHAISQSEPSEVQSIFRQNYPKTMFSNLRLLLLIKENPTLSDLIESFLITACATLGEISLLKRAKFNIFGTKVWSPCLLDVLLDVLITACNENKLDVNIFRLFIDFLLSNHHKLIHTLRELYDLRFSPGRDVFGLPEPYNGKSTIVKAFFQKTELTFSRFHKEIPDIENLEFLLEDDKFTIEQRRHLVLTLPPNQFNKLFQKPAVLFNISFFRAHFDLWRLLGEEQPKIYQQFMIVLQSYFEDYFSKDDVNYDSDNGNSSDSDSSDDENQRLSLERTGYVCDIFSSFPQIFGESWLESARTLIKPSYFDKIFTKFRLFITLLQSCEKTQYYEALLQAIPPKVLNFDISDFQDWCSDNKNFKQIIAEFQRIFGSAWPKLIWNFIGEPRALKRVIKNTQNLVLFLGYYDHIPDYCRKILDIILTLNDKCFIKNADDFFIFAHCDQVTDQDMIVVLDALSSDLELSMRLFYQVTNSMEKIPHSKLKSIQPFLDKFSSMSAALDSITDVPLPKENLIIFLKGIEDFSVLLKLLCLTQLTSEDITTILTRFLCCDAITKLCYENIGHVTALLALPHLIEKHRELILSDLPWFYRESDMSFDEINVFFTSCPQYKNWFLDNFRYYSGNFDQLMELLCLPDLSLNESHVIVSCLRFNKENQKPNELMKSIDSFEKLNRLMQLPLSTEQRDVILSLFNLKSFPGDFSDHLIRLLNLPSVTINDYGVVIQKIYKMDWGQNGMVNLLRLLNFPAFTEDHRQEILEGFYFCFPFATRIITIEEFILLASLPQLTEKNLTYILKRIMMRIDLLLKGNVTHLMTLLSLSQLTQAQRRFILIACDLALYNEQHYYSGCEHPYTKLIQYILSVAELSAVLGLPDFTDTERHRILDCIDLNMLVHNKADYEILVAMPCLTDQHRKSIKPVDVQDEPELFTSAAEEIQLPLTPVPTATLNERATSPIPMAFVESPQPVAEPPAEIMTATSEPLAAPESIFDDSATVIRERVQGLRSILEEHPLTLVLYQEGFRLLKSETMRSVTPFGTREILNLKNPKLKLQGLSIRVPIIEKFSAGPDHLNDLIKYDGSFEERCALMRLLLVAYIEVLEARKTNYDYHGLFRPFGAYSQRQKSAAAHNLIRHLIDSPETAYTAPLEMIGPLKQGRLSRLFEMYKKIIPEHSAHLDHQEISEESDQSLSSLHLMLKSLE